MIFSIGILAVSLSIDALFVGFAYGLNGTRIPFSSKLVVCLFSILYAGIAVFAGSAASHFLPPVAGRVIGAVILALIGFSMIIKGVVKIRGGDKKSKDAGDRTIFKWIVKSLGITVQILRNPDAGDIDRSGTIDMKEAVLLGSALSIDALGVGLGSALSGLSGWYIPLVIGFCQLLFLSAGLFSGAHIALLKRLDEKYTSMIPGFFLLALSVLRLI